MHVYVNQDIMVQLQFSFVLCVHIVVSYVLLVPFVHNVNLPLWESLIQEDYAIAQHYNTMMMARLLIVKVAIILAIAAQTQTHVQVVIQQQILELLIQ